MWAVLHINHESDKMNPQTVLFDPVVNPLFGVSPSSGKRESNFQEHVTTTHEEVEGGFLNINKKSNYVFLRDSLNFLLHKIRNYSKFVGIINHHQHREASLGPSASSPEEG